MRGRRQFQKSRDESAGKLKRQGDTATLTDRKYVHKPSKESYRNTPEYKYAISQWAFQCDARNFRITQAQFFNDKGVSLAKHQYSAGQTRYETALPDTPAASLLNIACAPKTAK